MTKRLSVDLDDDLHREFSKAALDADRPKADIARSLIREWVEEQQQSE